MLVAKTKIRKILYDYYANIPYSSKDLEQKILEWLLPYAAYSHTAIDDSTFKIPSNLNMSTILLPKRFIEFFLGV